MTISSASTTQVPGYIAGSWTIDAAHSDISFTIRHMMVSKVRGHFTEFSGEIVTAENPLESSVTASISLSSINTNNSQRDDHLRSADFFEVEKHPEMIYRSTGARSDGNDFVLTGELELHGVTKQVDLELELNGFGPDSYGGTRAGFTAKTQISRNDFGVDFHIPLDGGGVVLGDKIDITIEIEAILNS